MTDIQDKDRQIAELRTQIAALEAENANLQERDTRHTQILDAMQDMIICKDHNSAIVYANRAFREFYGMTLEELKGIIDAPFNQQEWTNQYLADDAYVLKTGRVRVIDEEPATRYDSQVRFFNTIKSPIFNVAGEVSTMVAVLRDITERKEMERRVSEFNSMVSHELRTPLTAIRAALGLIEGGQTEPISETNMDLIQIARTECDRMIRLINDLLDIKKIEANKLNLKIQALQPHDVITVVANNMNGVAQQSALRLSTEIDDTRSFHGDRDRLIQVLTNLVSNAIKFSPERTEILLRTKTAEDGAIRFSVSDRGPGIPADEFDKLFIAFQQLDSSDTRAKGGTGLGLAICKAIVERHGGRIGFETREGNGSTFWFDLPATMQAH